VLPGAPTIYTGLLDHPSRGAFDLSSLRLAVTGAADVRRRRYSTRARRCG